MSQQQTSWLMSLNKHDQGWLRLKDLPPWARQYLIDLRKNHSIVLEVYGKATCKWQPYSMTAALNAKDYYRLAGAPHCAAIRTGYEAKQATYSYVFVTDPQPVPEGTVVSQIDGKAIVGQLIPY